MAKKKAVTKSSVDEELDLIRKERDSILNFKINFKCKKNFLNLFMITKLQ